MNSTPSNLRAFTRLTVGLASSTLLCLGLLILPAGCGGDDDGAAYRQDLARITPDTLADELIARAKSVQFQRKVAELNPDDPSLSEEGRDLGEELRIKGQRTPANNLEGLAKELAPKLNRVEGTPRDQALNAVIARIESSDLDSTTKTTLVKEFRAAAAAIPPQNQPPATDER